MKKGTDLSPRGIQYDTPEELAEELSRKKDKQLSYTYAPPPAATVYRKGSDDSFLAEDIRKSVTKLKETIKRPAVNWKDINDVKKRTFTYFEACAISETYPSVMGLAVYGFGISRVTLNNYLQTHNNEVTAFITEVKDIMADILTNASLHNKANVGQAIFQLKNHFGHADVVELKPVKADPDDDVNVEDIRRKYEK